MTNGYWNLANMTTLSRKMPRNVWADEVFYTERLAWLRRRNRCRTMEYAARRIGETKRRLREPKSLLGRTLSRRKTTMAQNGDFCDSFRDSVNGQMPKRVLPFVVLVLARRLTTFGFTTFAIQAVLLAAFGSTPAVAQDLGMRVRVVGTDGLQAVKNGEVHVDVYDTSGNPVTSYYERRTLVIGNRRIKGDNVPLKIPKPGQYKVVATAIMEEEIPGCPWKGMNAPEVGRVDTDPFGIYTITKVDPDLKERIPGGTADVVGYHVSKRYRLMASSSCLTHVAADEVTGNEDDVFIVIPIQEYVAWWKKHVNFVGSKVMEYSFEKLVPGGSVQMELARSVTANLLVTGVAEPDHFLSSETAVEIFTGAAVTLVFHAAGGPQKIGAELAIMYIPAAAVEAIGAQVVSEGVDSDDYEHEAVSSIQMGTSGAGEGYVVVRNFGPPMRNVRVLASARSQVTVEPAIINVSDVIAELPTNAQRRIPWQINRTQLGNRRADAVLGLKLAYELHHANASVPQRCSDNLTYYIFDESPDPVTRISVEPATQSVHQGVDAEFRISVRRLDDQVGLVSMSLSRTILPDNHIHSRWMIKVRRITDRPRTVYDPADTSLYSIRRLPNSRCMPELSCCQRPLLSKSHLKARRLSQAMQQPST